MNFNPYDQARDDARSGRMLTPGADPSVYYGERNAIEANRKAQEDAQRGPPTSPGAPADPGPSPAPSWNPATPEEARAGLIGCAVIPVVIALAPLYFAVYPLTLIAALAASSLTWQATQSVSPGGSFLNGSLVLLAFVIGVFGASRAEQRLERLPLYRLARIPARALGFWLLLLAVLAATGRTTACLHPDPEAVTLAEVVTVLRAYYGCVFSDSGTVALATAVAAGLTALAMVPRLRGIWHTGLQRLRLRTVR
jgi:hypothetical protein